MVRINEELKAKCRKDPDGTQAVIITLGPGGLGKDPSQVGLAHAEPIPGLTGVFKGQLTGSRVLELAASDDIEEITEDSEVRLS